MKFKIGDKVIGINDTYYDITKKGNGYGVVKEIGFEVIRIKWFGARKGIDDKEYAVKTKYFELAENKMEKLKKKLIG